MYRNVVPHWMLAKLFSNLVNCWVYDDDIAILNEVDTESYGSVCFL